MALHIDVSQAGGRDGLPSPQVRRINELFSEENVKTLITQSGDGESKVSIVTSKQRHTSLELTGSLDLKYALDRSKSWDSDSETLSSSKKKEAPPKRREEVKKDDGSARPRSSSLKRLSMKLNLSKKPSAEEETKVIPLTPLEEEVTAPTTPTTAPSTPTTPTPTTPPTPTFPLTAREAPVIKQSLERATSVPHVAPERPQIIPNNSESRIVYAPANPNSPEQERKVTAATVDQLVCLLAGTRAPDKDFVVHFLLTHHRFMNSKDLLLKLVNRYNLQPPDGCSPAEADAHTKTQKIIQVRVINVMKKWIERLIMSFQQNLELLLALQKFIQTLLARGGTEAIWGSNLQVALLQAEEAQANPASGVVSTLASPKPRLPKTTISSELELFDIDPLELARQLTLIESQSLSQISPDEYKNKAWCSKDCATTSPNVLDIITRFNRLSYWMAAEIMSQPELANRVKVLCRFIKIGEILRMLNNLQGVMTVCSALNMSAVQRLHDTWRALPSKYSMLFDNITDVMSAAFNFKTYRELLKNSSPPLVPFQGVYLSDLTMMEEAPDILDNDLVNFRKMMLVGDVINDVQKFQQVKYVFLEVLCIQEFLKSVSTTMDDKQLHELSRKIEPRKEPAG